MRSDAEGPHDDGLPRANPVRKTVRAGPAVVGTEATLLVSAEDDESASLTVRWDLDYDGKFDTGWLPLGEQK